jgi:hypothetical protein
MIVVIGLAIIAALAILSILADPDQGNAERRLPRDPRTDLPLWALLGRR